MQPRRKSRNIYYLLASWAITLALDGCATQSQVQSHHENVYATFEFTGELSIDTASNGITNLGDGNGFLLVRDDTAWANFMLRPKVPFAAVGEARTALSDNFRSILSYEKKPNEDLVIVFAQNTDFSLSRLDLSDMTCDGDIVHIVAQPYIVKGYRYPLHSIEERASHGQRPVLILSFQKDLLSGKTVSVTVKRPISTSVYFWQFSSIDAYKDWLLRRKQIDSTIDRCNWSEGS